MRIAIAVLIAVLLPLAFTATPSPSTQPVDFTVHCKNGDELVAVKVTAAGASEGVDAIRKPDDINNPHFGKFWYSPRVENEKFRIEVACGRASNKPDSSDYKKSKTLSRSDQTSWGSGRNFVCTPDPLRVGVCEIASKDVVITPSCTAGSLGAVATNVFVTPSINQAGSATREGNEIFKFSLPAATISYVVHVECQQGDQKWEAKSAAPTIGAASFDCARPQAPYEQYGVCIRPLPVG